jgi:hypothetical protein
VAEAVRERRGSALQLSEDSLDSISISAATHLKSEASSLQCGLEVLGTVDEKDGGFDIVFFEVHGERVR